MSKKIRTRYAPSPTGKMHVGNLRTALYEYLLQNMKAEISFYVLRIPIRSVMLKVLLI